MRVNRRIAAVLAFGLACALSFALGRATAPDPQSDLASVASLRRAFEDPDWLVRSYRFSSFLVNLNPENLPAALEALEPHLAWMLTDEFRMLMLAWSRFDPRGAFEHSQTWPPQFRRNAGGAAMYAWGFRNPLEAVRELETVENLDLQGFWAARLLAGWIHGKYRDTAAEYVASLPESPIRHAYFTTLAWELSKEGPAAVMRWAEEVPDELASFKQGVFLSAASTLVGADPALAARWLRDHVGRDYARDALLMLASGWATNDPRAALAWLTALPPGEQRDAAVEAGFTRWLRRAPAQAESWLLEANPSPAVDPAVRVLIERTRELDLEKSKRWEARLAPPG
jgi:hypothetical protein